MTTSVVFDLDGTLIDSAPDIHAVANRVLLAEGVAPITLEQTRGFIGNGARVLVARIMAERGLPVADLDRLHRAFLDQYQDAHDLTEVYPGVIAALDVLAGRGCVLGICTNKPLRPALAVLDHFGLTGWFASIIGGDSLKQSKPDPAPLLHVFDALSGHNRVYVGDSEVDHQTALAARVPFALFTQGYRKAPIADFAGAVPFSVYDALPGIVERLGQTLR